MTRRVWFGIAFTLMLVVGSRHLAEASPVSKIDPNDTFATAQSVDGFFSLDFDPNIGSPFTNTSTSIPHVTVTAFGPDASDGTLDWYSFTVLVPGAIGYFDVDFGCCDDYDENLDGTDPNLELVDSTGFTLASNDDLPPGSPDPGSIHVFDSFISYIFSTPGVYMIGYGECCFMDLPDVGADYALHISISDHPFTPSEVPEPATLTLLGTGVLAVVRSVRRKRAAR